jgi:outer membrane protein OmpA-like peptidoglycan-associated protein
LSLKQLSSFSAGFGGAVSDNFLINYNFETSSKGVLGISSGTHEINLGILINRKSGFSRYDIFPVTRNQLIEENYEIEIQNLKKEIENLKTHFNKTISIQNDRIIEAENRKKSESNLKNVTENVWADSIVYENIKFAVNTNLLFESSESELRILVVKMIKNPSLTIKIYCDVRNSGSPIFLNNLKQKRSQSIKNLLIEKGIIESRIIICRGIVDENENVKILFSEKI